MWKVLFVAVVEASVWGRETVSKHLFRKFIYLQESQGDNQMIFLK